MAKRREWPHSSQRRRIRDPSCPPTDALRPRASCSPVGFRRFRRASRWSCTQRTTRWPLPARCSRRTRCSMRRLRSRRRRSTPRWAPGAAARRRRRNARRTRRSPTRCAWRRARPRSGCSPGPARSNPARRRPCDSHRGRGRDSARAWTWPGSTAFTKRWKQISRFAATSRWLPTISSCCGAIACSHSIPTASHAATPTAMRWRGTTSRSRCGGARRCAPRPRRARAKRRST